jgi:hypothetical protein
MNKEAKFSYVGVVSTECHCCPCCECECEEDEQYRVTKEFGPDLDEATQWVIGHSKLARSKGFDVEGSINRLGPKGGDKGARTVTGSSPSVGWSKAPY